MGLDLYYTMLYSEDPSDRAKSIKLYEMQSLLLWLSHTLTFLLMIPILERLYSFAHSYAQRII
jgi:hypothetical protein